MACFGLLPLLSLQLGNRKMFANYQNLVTPHLGNTLVPNTSAALIIYAGGKFSLRLISVPILIPVPPGTLSNY